MQKVILEVDGNEHEIGFDVAKVSGSVQITYDDDEIFSGNIFDVFMCSYVLLDVVPNGSKYRMITKGDVVLIDTISKRAIVRGISMFIMAYIAQVNTGMPGGVK